MARNLKIIFLRLLNQNSITLLEYIGNKLRFWSDTEFDVPRILVDSIYKKPFIFLQNGWFLTKSAEVGSEVIVGLIRIRNDYGFENDIISNGFVKHFGIPDNTGFSRNKNASEYQIFSNDGTFLFSLLYPEVKGKSYFIYIPLLLWGLAFLAILYLTQCLANYLVSRRREILAVIATFIILSFIYLLILIARKPAVLLSDGPVLTVQVYNECIHTIAWTFIVTQHPVVGYGLCFFRNLKVSETARGSGHETAWFSLSLLLIPGALLFALYHYVFSHLIFNSNINFETFKVLDLDIFSLTGFITLLLLFSIPFLYILKVFRTIKQPDLKTVIFSAFTAMIIYPVIFLKDPLNMLSSALFYFTVTMILWLFSTRYTGCI